MHCTVRHDNVYLLYDTLKQLIFPDAPRAIMVCDQTSYQSAMKIMQSYDHLLFGDILEVSVGVIKYPKGKGQPRKQLLGTTKEAMRAKNKSIHYIDNNDGLCLARSLVVARAHEQYNDKKITKNAWRWIKDSKNDKQRKAAVDLIAAIQSSPEESASFAQIPEYEKVLERNIVVIGASCNNKVLRPKSLQYEKSYYVYYLDGEEGHPGHFHVIINPQGLYGLDHFCHECMNAYNNHPSRKHNCFATCKKYGVPRRNIRRPPSDHLR